MLRLTSENAHPSAVLDQVVTQSLRFLNADRAALFLYDSQKDTLRTEVSIGLSQQYLDMIANTWKELPLGRVFTKPVIHVTGDTRTDPEFTAARAAVEAEGIRTLVSFPLFSKEVFQGRLALYFDEVREVSEEKISAIQSFADLAAIAIENSQLYDREKEASRRLDRLQDLTLQVTSSLELSEVLDAIAKATVELLGGLYSEIFLLEKETDLLRCQAFYGAAHGPAGGPPTLRSGVGLGGWVVQNGKPAIVADIHKDPRWVVDPSWAMERDLHSHICVPLFLSGEASGFLGCFVQKPDRFTESDLRLLESLAAHAAAAIEKARAFEEERVRSEREEALRKVVRDITESLDLPVLFSRICESVSELLGVEITDLSILDEKTEALTVSAAFGKREEGEVSFIPKGKGIVHRVVSGKKPVAVAEVLKDPDWVDRDWAERAGIRSFLGIPLILHDRVVGVLSCFTSKKSEFRADEIELLQDFADQAAVALENARLFTAVKQRATTLEVLDEIAKAINSTLDFQELFKITVEQVKRVIPCDECVLYVLGADKKVVSEFFMDSDDEDRRRWLEARRDLAGSQFEQILQTQKPLYTPEARKSPYPRIQSQAAAGLRSCLNAPILSEGECIGFWNAGSSESDVFTDDHIQLLVSVADHLAVAIKNAQLYGEVRETGERLDRFVRGATDGIITVDLDGRITSWNSGAEAIYGYSEEEMLREQLGRIYPEGAGEPKDFWDRLRSGETNAPVEIGCRQKDGSLVEVSFSVSAIRDHRGQIVGFSGIIRDIGAKKRAEKALRISEEKYRTLFEEAQDGITIVDEEGRYIDYNQKASDLLGYTREDLVGKPVVNFLAPESRDSFPQRLAQILQTGGLEPYEAANLRKDGTLVHLEIAAGVIELKGQKHVLFFLRDITERKRMEEAMKRQAAKLERSNQELDDFVYIASHDLKEPLRGIHNYSRFLLEDYTDKLDDDGRAKLETLPRLTKHLDNLIDSLLYFSQVGRAELAVNETDLNDVLYEVIDSLHISLQEYGVDLRIPHPLPIVTCDRAQIMHVFRNLITNAMKYNDKADKWIEVGCRSNSRIQDTEEHSPLALYVRDNGIGLQEKHLESIFRIFKRLHGREEFGGGTGAGLTIAKKIVERHGGRMWVESTYREGTTFYFSLQERT